MTIWTHPLRRHALAWLALGLAAIALVFAANQIRPLPFATTDDNWLYFLPLIKAHTDALLNGNNLVILWQLGAGWSPYESGQIGLYYPIYILSNLVSRLLGQPLALLEVSAAFHLWLAALFTWHLAPLEDRGIERMGWSLISMVPAGPLMLGLNWHNYFSCYPWFLAIAFIIKNHLENNGNRSSRILLLISSLFFYMTSHIQMYVIGIILLALWALSDYGKSKTKLSIFWLFVCQIPISLSVLFLKITANGANVSWMDGRSEPDFMLRQAQNLGTVIQGIIFGNLFHSDGFKLWQGVSWTGIGIFFCPIMLFIFIVSFKNKSWLNILFFTSCIIFMSAGTFEFIKHMAFGPFYGFRWTWKICIFIAPLAFVSIIPQFEYLTKNIKIKFSFMTLIFVFSLFVLARGAHFDLWPSLSAAHSIGGTQIIEEIKSLSQITGIKPGDRIAFIGEIDMHTKLPLPLLGLYGNTPILSDMESSHLFEPMEPNKSAEYHYYLGLPWRAYIATEELIKHPKACVEMLKKIGVNTILSSDPEISSHPGSQAYTDRLGRVTYVIKIQNNDHMAPFPLHEYINSEAMRYENGELFIKTNTKKINTGREIEWQYDGNGWHGKPHSLPKDIIYGTIALFLCVSIITWRGLPIKNIQQKPENPNRHIK